MKCTFLGTGTSHGVPMIGCACPVCLSHDPKNKRLRSSIWVQAAGQSILIDTTPDFRAQALRAGISRLDAVLITHTHADHIFGFDDLRCFYRMHNNPVQVFASPKSVEFIKQTFSYIYDDHPKGVSVLRADVHSVTGPFSVGEVHLTPLPVPHGRWLIYGYLLENEGKRLAYIPDCNELPPDVAERLHGVDVVILDALRHRPHPSHFSLQESLDALQRIRAERSFLTHACHDLEHEATSAILPPRVRLAYDELTLEL